MCVCVSASRCLDSPTNTQCLLRCRVGPYAQVTGAFSLLYWASQLQCTATNRVAVCDVTIYCHWWSVGHNVGRFTPVLFHLENRWMKYTPDVKQGQLVFHLCDLRSSIIERSTIYYHRLHREILKYQGFPTWEKWWIVSCFNLLSTAEAEKLPMWPGWKCRGIAHENWVIPSFQFRDLLRYSFPI